LKRDQLLHVIRIKRRRKAAKWNTLRKWRKAGEATEKAACGCEGSDAAKVHSSSENLSYFREQSEFSDREVVKSTKAIESREGSKRILKFT
jgi:hypothetical protein